MIPVFAHKRLPPPWIDLVLRFRSDPAAGLNHIKCIAQMPLTTWQALTADEIRLRIPGAPGAKKRFCTALQRFQKIKLAISTFIRLQSLDVLPSRGDWS